MPELPEVEIARRLIADLALGRRIVGVDDADSFVCRPYSPGELRAALTGRVLTAAYRRGKAIWCETRSRPPRRSAACGVRTPTACTARCGRSWRPPPPRAARIPATSSRPAARAAAARAAVPK